MKLEILDLMANAEDEEFQMAPMIDIVFLLLIYFMVTTSIIKLEADLGIQLPGQVRQETTLKIPDEQIIEITADNQVVLNGSIYGSPQQRGLPTLTETLVRFRQASDLTQTPAMITIQAHADSTHQRVIDVMDACAAANVTSVSFGLGE